MIGLFVLVNVLGRRNVDRDIVYLDRECFELQVEMAKAGHHVTKHTFA